ncbi:hypothetical protein D3C71_1464170 [compost metagenome]
MTVAIIIEIHPDGFRRRAQNSVGPDLQLLITVVVTIPLAHTVKADIDVIGGFYEFVR